MTESSKRIEHALIKYISALDNKTRLALDTYFNILEKHASWFKREDYRLDVGLHVIAPIPLLGTFQFDIEKLYFDVKHNNPFRGHVVRILYSSMAVVPALSLNLSSFVTVRHWTGKHGGETSSLSVSDDKLLLIKRGEYSILNFYYFESLAQLGISDMEYLNTLLMHMLISLVLSPLPAPIAGDKLQNFHRMLPFLSIYGSDVSGVEALGVTRCLLKIDKDSLEAGGCRQVSIRSLLWGELLTCRLKALVVCGDSLIHKPSVGTIYVPKLYFEKLVEKLDAKGLLVDSIVMSLFIIRNASGNPQRDLMLFNILAIPLNIYALDSEPNKAALALLEYTTASTYSSQLARLVIKNSFSLEHVLNTSIELSEHDLRRRLQNLLNALQLKQLMVELSQVPVKTANGKTFSGLLSYAYIHLLPFPDISPSREGGKTGSRENLISIPGNLLYSFLPILGFALYKKLDFTAFKTILRCIVSNLRKPPSSDQLMRIANDINYVLSRVTDVSFGEVSYLLNNIYASWQLYMARLEYLQYMSNTS